MATQKKLLSMVSNFVVGLWDGLDECEISRLAPDGGNTTYCAIEPLKITAREIPLPRQP